MSKTSEARSANKDTTKWESEKLGSTSHSRHMKHVICKRTERHATGKFYLNDGKLTSRY